MSRLVYKVSLRPNGAGAVEATGGTDARVLMGKKGTPGAFTPVELLLAALAGCSAMDLQELAEASTTGVADFELRVRGIRSLDRAALSSVSIDYEAAHLDPSTLERWLDVIAERCTVAVTVRDGCGDVAHRPAAQAQTVNGHPTRRHA
jgi:uncharacterized OsmC-like protein